MADARMLLAALNAFPESFTGAGSRYAVVPILTTGAFHPKLHLRFGEKKACLVVGSANATAAGWGRNQEVVARLDWSLTSHNGHDNDVQGRLIAKAYAFVEHWLSMVQGETVRHKLKLIIQQSPWLDNVKPAQEALVLSDGAAIDLFCESGGNTPTMLQQFVGHISGAEVKRLIIISPYWDKNLRGFRDLRTALGYPETFAALSPKYNTFPIAQLRKSDDLSFVQLRQIGQSKFVHAKVIIAQTETNDHVLFGSANCSDDALGYLSGASRNAEVSIYRRLPSGSACDILDIDLHRIVSISTILEQDNASLDNHKDIQSRPAGVLELHGRQLVWWPPSSENAEGASAQIAGRSFTFTSAANGQWRANYTENPSYPLIAKICYADGFVAGPIIVHAEIPLRKAAPGKIDPRLADALDNMHGGDGDLLELAARAHLIFEAAPRTSVSGSEQRKKDIPASSQDGKKYETAEAFREAMLRGNAKTGRLSEIDTTFCDLFSVIASGVEAGLQGQSEDNGVDEDLLAGESDEESDDPSNAIDHDDENISLKDSKPDNGERRETTALPVIAAFKPEQIASRRKLLVKALDCFEKMLALAKQDPSVSLARLPVQTVFMFRLMQYGVGHPHLMDDRSEVRLLERARCNFGKSGDQTFSVQTARILRSIWCEPGRLGARVPLPSSHYELPDDIAEFIIVSRWALGRAYLDSKSMDQHGDKFHPSQVTKFLLGAMETIYAATEQLGVVDDVEEHELITKHDTRIGCNDDETIILLKFLKELKGRKVNSWPSETVL